MKKKLLFGEDRVTVASPVYPFPDSPPRVGLHLTDAFGYNSGLDLDLGELEDLMCALIEAHEMLRAAPSGGKLQ